MHQLVCSGYSRTEQTSWELLDSFTLDVILDFAYGQMVKDLTPEQKAEVDKDLYNLVASAEAEKHRRTLKLSDGRVVQISEARLARIRANSAGLQKMKG